MTKELKNDKYTRRRFLELGSGAVASAGVLSMTNQAGSARYADQAQKDKAASDPGPKNTVVDAQNQSSIAPPPTDAGAVQTFKYPFSFAHKRLEEDGWSRPFHRPNCLLLELHPEKY